MLFFAKAFAMSVDEIKVYKSKNRMDLISEGHVIKSYRVMLGRGGPLAKTRKGDNLVPEGSYYLDYKNIDSLFHKSIHVSYPNEEDRRRANEQGVDPGGDIMIHGFPNHPKPLFKLLQKIGIIKHVNWTAGCVAIDNDEMDAVFESVEINTPIRIFN